MSCKITPGARLRRHVNAVLIALLGALLVAMPSHAQQARVAKCAACAPYAADVNRLAAVAEQRKRDVVAAQRAVDAAKAAYESSREQVRQTEEAGRIAVRSGVSLDLPVYEKSLKERQAQEANDYLAYEIARARHAAALTAESKALSDVAQATALLNACEDKNCPDPAGGAPQAAVGQRPANNTPIPPGSKLSPRQPLCPFCAESARRRNELVDVVNRAEAVMQAMRNAVADAQARLDTLRTDIETARTILYRPPASGSLFDRQPEIYKQTYLARLNELEARLPRVESERNQRAEMLRVATATHTTLYNEFLFREAILNACERQFCQRPQAGAAPVAPVTSVTPPGQPAPTGTTPTGTTPAPQSPAPAPAPAPGDRRQSRVELQIFGGGNVSVSRLNLTGVDDFFGAGSELIDRRSSAVTKVSPALGAFGRVYIDLAESTLPVPRDRLFLTAGMIFTPGRGNLGFDVTGVNTVPQGDVRSESFRSFLATVMVGYQMPFTVGTTPFTFDIMAGAAIGHETTRVIVRREGGAPAGAGASAETSGLYVDPVIGFAISTQVANIAGFGTVNVGVMGLAVIGTGSRSVRVSSANFGSQDYTAEHKRLVEFFLGLTLTLGVF